MLIEVSFWIIGAILALFVASSIFATLTLLIEKKRKKLRKRELRLTNIILIINMAMPLAIFLTALVSANNALKYFLIFLIFLYPLTFLFGAINYVKILKIKH